MKSRTFVLSFILFISSLILVFEALSLEELNWKLSDGKGTLSVSGTGKDSNRWEAKISLQPLSTYRLTFYAKREPNTTGGCITAGFQAKRKYKEDLVVSGVNRDFSADQQWTKSAYVFVTPPESLESLVYLGQWHMKGKVLFKDFSISPVELIHSKKKNLTLGDSEEVRDGRYIFKSRWGSTFSNYSRTLYDFTAGFNSNRWIIDEGKYLTYCHNIDSFAQREAKVDIKTQWYQQGSLSIQASKNGDDWTEFASISKEGNFSFKLPETIFPTDKVYLRLFGKGLMQVKSYSYTAKLKKSVPDTLGQTVFFEIAKEAPEGVSVRPKSVGTPEKGKLELKIEVKNELEEPKILKANLKLLAPDKTERTKSLDITLKSKSSKVITLSERLRKSGEYYLVFSLSETGKEVYKMETSASVSALYSSDYGKMLLENKKLAVWWCKGTYKVSKERPLPKDYSDFVLVKAARNEYEPFQIILNPKFRLEQVEINATPFVAEDAKISKENIDIKVIEYVHIKEPTDSFGCAGDWPDPLPPYKDPLNLDKELNQPLWVTVYVPKDVPAGDYKGEILINSEELQELNIPVKLRVYDFTLPDETHTKTAYGVGLNRSFHSIEDEKQSKKVWDLYMQEFKKHRISPYTPYSFAPLKWQIKESEEVSFDFSLFDKAMARYIDEFKFNAFNARGVISAIPGELNGYKRFTPEFEELYKKVCGPIEKHLKEKGWSDEGYFYWFDEPSEEEYPFVIKGMKLLKRVFPSVKRLLTEQPEEPLFGHVDIWVPVLSRYNAEDCKARQKAGDDVWWYVCCGPKAPYPNNFIDHPAINHRIRFWMQEKYGVSGSLYWQTTYWRSYGKSRNPWEEPASHSPSGTFWGNGDGFLLYPPRKKIKDLPVIEPPVGSIRWEMLREGIEDREYFFLLREYLKKSKETPIKAKIASGLPDELVRSLTDFEKDPENLYDARDILAEAIEELKD